MPSPTITLTITLKDLQGVAVGSVGSPAFVEIALANYGPILPRVSGTAMLPKVGPQAQRIPYTGTPITVNLFGNDVITPAGSYYAITILDDELNILQTGAYVFTGTISADLSTLPQIFPSAVSSVMGSEVTLQATATPTFDCRLVNGPVEFYLVLTENITSSTLLPNFAGQIVILRLQQDATGARTFVWPTNWQNPPAINSAPNSVTSAAGFVASNGNVYPLGGDDLPVPQVGDILRGNASGGFDAVNYAQNDMGIFPIFQAASNIFFLTGILAEMAGANTITYTANSHADVNPTATSQNGRTITGVSSAQPNPTIGFATGSNGNVSLFGILAFYRWTCELALITLSSCRYWMGFACFNTGGTGNNGAAINGTNAYVQDTPNKTTIGFRFSAGVDTNWQAVVITAGVSSGAQTTVDTGIPADTAKHRFEILPNATATAIIFMIDGKIVATITTNIPNPASGGDACGEPFLLGDNKNTPTVVSLTYYAMQISLK